MQTTTTTTTITIKGTHCNSCKLLIEDVCKEIKGVQSCVVNFQTGETIIEHDENLDWQALKKEIEGLGNYTINLNEK
jgi:copper chaperone CopZ